jgi:hypothetical protein
MSWLLFLVLAAAVALAVVKERDPYIGLLGVPDVVSFTAVPEVVAPSEPVTLSWQTRGTPSVSIDFGVEDRARGTYEHRAGLPPTGTMKMRLQHDTVFMMGCESVANLNCQPAVASVRVKGSAIPIE